MSQPQGSAPATGAPPPQTHRGIVKMVCLCVWKMCVYVCCVCVCVVSVSVCVVSVSVCVCVLCVCVLVSVLQLCAINGFSELRFAY